VRRSANAVVYYDHGSGEIADFVTVEETNGRLILRFYPCKGAGGAAPGHRVGDVSVSPTKRAALVSYAATSTFWNGSYPMRPRRKSISNSSQFSLACRKPAYRAILATFSRPLATISRAAASGH